MKYRPLMILGAGSDVGKSTIAAALCRIFHQEGIRVAPFKAQNLALNSFITSEGGEMGRAQVVQAHASGLIPHVDMNPILLKPNAELGAQVIIQGRVYGDFNLHDYYRRKSVLVKKVMASFRRLAQRYELIVLEGAGSVAELNLSKNDIVNFSMAKRANAVALLVADIERGGVFAATIGTRHLLTPSERRVLAGFIINKFRGDPSFFIEGREIIEKRTGMPVMGVLPFLKDVAIPQEDSVALERKGCQPGRQGASAIRVGIIRLPHISNHTDFEPLEQEVSLEVRYLDHGSFEENLDLLILPGTKNTIGDLRYLKQNGLFHRIKNFVERGGRVIGICGGYQMLGKLIQDPLGVEGEPREEEGLGVLPLVTSLAKIKTTSQVKVREAGLYSSNLELDAYEIHMGVTRSIGVGKPAFTIIECNGRPAAIEDGWASQDRRVWGTYLHGVFDSDDFRNALIEDIAQEKGLTIECSSCEYQEFLERQYDRVADWARTHLDMDKIWSLIRDS